MGGRGVSGNREVRGTVEGRVNGGRGPAVDRSWTVLHRDSGVHAMFT